MNEQLSALRRDLFRVASPIWHDGQVYGSQHQPDLIYIMLSESDRQKQWEIELRQAIEDGWYEQVFMLAKLLGRELTLPEENELVWVVLWKGVTRSGNTRLLSLLKRPWSPNELERLLEIELASEYPSLAAAEEVATRIGRSLTGREWNRLLKGSLQRPEEMIPIIDRLARGNAFKFKKLYKLFERNLEGKLYHLALAVVSFFPEHAQIACFERMMCALINTGNCLEAKRVADSHLGRALSVAEIERCLEARSLRGCCIDESLVELLPQDRRAKWAWRALDCEMAHGDFNRAKEIAESLKLPFTEAELRPACISLIDRDRGYLFRDYAIVKLIPEPLRTEMVQRAIVVDSNLGRGFAPDIFQAFLDVLEGEAKAKSKEKVVD